MTSNNIPSRLTVVDTRRKLRSHLSKPKNFSAQNYVLCCSGVKTAICATNRMHKESHQILDLVSLFDPISKYSAEILEPEIIPELVRKVFKDAQAENPGGTFISFPENIAGEEIPDDVLPL